ncbi:MAG: HlyD family efflux transporter periplasmic adaptor subunit [Proteobacteria bacterium]|nr:HlyD family efflux transporter periplasmic adaptor subunit [Pseudomonadota bacterium]
MRRAALVLVGLAACDAAPSSAPGGSTVALVTRGTILERVLLTGELRAGISIELDVPKTESWELTIRWMAEDGAVVKAGDRVLEFDNASFVSGLEGKRVAAREATSAFATARDVAKMATIDKQFAVRQQEIALEKAQLVANVPADLLPQRTAQERQLDKLKAEVAVDRARKDLLAQTQSTTLDDRVKQIDLERAKRGIADAEQTIAALMITAPRDGVISIGEHPWEGRRFQVGDTTQPGMTIVTLPDFSQPMEIRAELSDVDDGRITVGMAGTCTLDAYPTEPLPCKVVELSPVARARNRQSLRRGFAVKLSIANRDPERMRPGMSVKAELPRPPIANALLVPRGAIVGTTTVEVVLAGGAHRPVTLGACDAKQCEVLQGLADGDRVVVANPGGGA